MQFPLTFLGIYYGQLWETKLDNRGNLLEYYFDSPFEEELDSYIHIVDGDIADEDLKNKLKEFMDKLDPKYTKPSFMAIVVANGMAFRRPDGIFVIPLNLLKN